MSYNAETNLWEGYIYKIWNEVNDKLYVGQTIATLKDRWHGHMSSYLNEKRYHTVLYSAMKKYGREKFHISELEKITAKTKEELIELLNKKEQKYIINLHTWIHDPLGTGYNTEKGGLNKSVYRKRVCKYDLNLNLLDTYNSLSDAARMNNIDSATIGAVCKHDYYTAAGFIWAYENDNPIKPNYDIGVKRRIEATKRYWDSYHEKHKYDPPKSKKIIPSRALPAEIKRQNRFNRLNCKDERIFVYNTFGDIVYIYNDYIDAIENMPISAQELRKNLNGINLTYKGYIIRYENDSFDKYPRSKYYIPIILYDLNGIYIDKFESIRKAEEFCHCTQGEIVKAIKRNGSCSGYIPAYYK